MSLAKTLCCGLAALMLLGAMGPPSQAADGERWVALSDTVFQQVNRDSGLLVTALAEDGDGFLWVGTQEGLLRWDGYRLREYKPAPQTAGALPDNFIESLHADRRGRLWIGTNGAGLARYDKAADRFISYRAGDSGLSGVQVPAIVDDDAGGLWIGTENGLDRIDLDSEAITHVDQVAENPPNARIQALLRDRQGALWVGTAAGLVRRDAESGRFVAVTLPAVGTETPGVTALFEAGDGQIWIGTSRYGAYVLDPGTGAARPVDATLSREEISAIAEPQPGELWLGTNGHGIVTVAADFHIGRIRHDPVLPTSIAGDVVGALYRDRSGLIWAGTDRGLGRYDPNQAGITTAFGGASRESSVSGPDIRAVLAMPGGGLWVGFSTGGVDILDPAGIRICALQPDPERPDTALPAGRVLSLAAASDGSVYIGTAHGLYRADSNGQRLTRLAVPERQLAGDARTLLIDDGVLWLGGSDGLWATPLEAGEPVPRFGPGSASRLTDPRVVALARAADAPGAERSLWVGTMNGLNRLDLASGTIEQIRAKPDDPEGLAAGFVSSLLTDRQGRLWVATFGGGIAILQARDADGHPRFRRLDLPQGLPNSNVDSLLQDRSGKIWASTDNGIAVIDPDTLAIRAFHRAEGAAIWAYWTGSGTMGSAGELVFGGVGGLTIVRPDRLGKWSYHPPVRVTDLRVGGKPVPAGGAITIQPDANSLAVEFSALDYSAPERNRYAYRLDGFDEGWVETDALHRLAAYTNLPPGDYVLRLRGSNRDGVWTEGGPELPISVRPAWFQTLWCRLAEAIAALLLVAAIIQRRTAYLRRREQELERLVRARTAELRDSQKLLERLAYADALTGLPNRRMFAEDCRKMLASAGRGGGAFALLLIDLDGFKNINDTLGHDAGDALLIEVGARLRTVVRAIDTVARLGGDEFAILLAQDPGPGIDIVCQRIAESLRQPVTLKGRRMTIGTSIGIARFPQDGKMQDRLYASADLALYAAKRAGRNTWRTYDAAMERAAP
jgi:diguanylate cyclase (GGDEF)-like protein